MICGYNNIYDLCVNRYTYQYVYGSGSIYDPVLRIDKNTKSQSYISPTSSDIILPCDYSDETEAITSWDCYQIYKNFSLSVSDSSTDNSKSIQRSLISRFNNETLNAGINVIIDDGTNSNNIIILKSSVEDQIHIGNIAIYANLAYEKNINSTMPPIIDMYGNSYNFNYQILSDVCIQYLNANIQYCYINKDLNFQLNNAINIHDIEICNYCDSFNFNSPKSYDAITNSNLYDSRDNDKNLDINIEIKRCFVNDDCPPGTQCVAGICSYSPG